MGVDWTLHFDAIYCISLADNIRRRDLMREELRRVGILDSGIFQWKITVRNNLYRYIWQNPSFQCDEWWRGMEVNLNCTMGHYEIMLESLARGFRRVLIIEDDIRFAKDENNIFRIMAFLPDHNTDLPPYDICLFDKNVSSRPRTPLHNAITYARINAHYFDYSTAFLGSTGCIALSEKAMRRFVEQQERKFMPADALTNRINAEGDVVNDDGLRRVASIANLAVQDMRLKGDQMNDVDRHLYDGIADLTKYNL